MDPEPFIFKYLIHKIHDISGLSFYDYATLIGNWQYLASGKAGTEAQLDNRGYSAEALEAMKKHQMTTTSPTESQGLRFRLPLNEYKSDILDYSLVLHENYERGLLPFPGSVSEQPAQIIQIFRILSSLQMERLEKQQKRDEKHGRHLNKNKPRSR